MNSPSWLRPWAQLALWAFLLLSCSAEAPKEEALGDNGRQLALWEEGGASRSFQCVGESAAHSAALGEEVLEQRPMPFGCPRLEDENYDVLSAWLIDGAHRPSAEAEEALNAPLAPSTIAR